MHIFEGHLRQEPPFDPEIITFGDDVPSADGETRSRSVQNEARPFFVLSSRFVADRRNETRSRETEPRQT